MPKRSNDFQKLVYLIQHQLASNAKVTESQFLLDRTTNVNREVDIVIEATVGDDLIVVSIECQGRSRVANVEWVEQMIAKHQTLPTNKLILVSQSGFTKSALQKAKALSVKTMTLVEAIKADWKVMTDLDNILLGKWTIKPSACFASCQGPTTETYTLSLEMNHQLVEVDGKEIITVEEVFGVFLDMSLEDFAKDTETKTDDKQRYIVFTLESSLPENTFSIDGNGKKHKVLSLKFIAHAKQETELVNMHRGSFGSAQISFGNTENIDANALVTIVEHEYKSNTAAMMIRSKKERDEEIINLRAVNHPDKINRDLN
jgi:hypothetical protein